jgi:hypothetical protein
MASASASQMAAIILHIADTIEKDYPVEANALTNMARDLNPPVPTYKVDPQQYADIESLYGEDG